MAASANTAVGGHRHRGRPCGSPSSTLRPILLLLSFRPTSLVSSPPAPASLSLPERPQPCPDAHLPIWVLAFSFIDTLIRASWPALAPRLQAWLGMAAHLAPTRCREDALILLLILLTLAGPRCPENPWCDGRLRCCREGAAPRGHRHHRCLCCRKSYLLVGFFAWLNI